MKRRSLALFVTPLVVGLILGLLIGRFALTPSEVQVRGTVSVPGHQTRQVAFSYLDTTKIPGCNAVPVPVCFQTFVSNVTSSGAYSVTLPNGHLYSISTVDSPAALKSVNANSTCRQEMFFWLNTESSSVLFDVTCA